MFKIFPFALSSEDAQAADPMITFSAPREINSFAFFTSLMPPPTRTFPFRKSDFSNSVFAVVPRCFPS